MKYVGGTTYIVDGLNLLREKMFGGSGDRQNANNSAIIITDGIPSDDNTTVQTAIDAVHDFGIYTLVVGITELIDELTLKRLSSPPHKVYFNSCFYIIKSFEDRIKDG